MHETTVRIDVHKAAQGVMTIKRVANRAISQQAKDEIEVGLRLITNAIGVVDGFDYMRDIGIDTL